jgi:N-acetyl-gamma-glutamyl-phosphate reductase/acetylglutamate kinase
MPGTKLTK